MQNILETHIKKCQKNHNTTSANDNNRHKWPKKHIKHPKLFAKNTVALKWPGAEMQFNTPLFYTHKNNTHKAECGYLHLTQGSYYIGESWIYYLTNGLLCSCHWSRLTLMTHDVTWCFHGWFWRPSCCSREKLFFSRRIPKEKTKSSQRKQTQRPVLFLLSWEIHSCIMKT